MSRRYADQFASAMQGFDWGRKTAGELMSQYEINKANEEEDAKRAKSFDESQGDELRALDAAGTHDITHENGKYVARPKVQPTAPARTAGVGELKLPKLKSLAGDASTDPQDKFSSGFNADTGVAGQPVADVVKPQPVPEVSLAPEAQPVTAQEAPMPSAGEQAPAPVQDAGKTFAPSKQRDLTRQEIIDRHTRDAGVYTKYGMLDRARDLEGRAQSMTTADQQSEIHGLVVGEHKAKADQRNAIASVEQANQQRIKEFKDGKFAGMTLSGVMLKNGQDMASAISMMDPAKGAEYRQRVEQEAAGSAFHSFATGDLLGVEALLNSNEDGKKYEKLTQGKDQEGKSIVSVMVNGKPVTMDADKFGMSLLARAYPDKVATLMQRGDLTAEQLQVKREAFLMNALARAAQGGEKRSAGASSSAVRATRNTADHGFPLSRFGIKDQKGATDYIESVLDKVATQEPITGPDGKTPVDKAMARVEIGRQMAQIAKFNTDITDADSAMSPALKIARANLSGKPLPTAPVMKDGVWREGVSIDGQNLLVSGNQLSDNAAVAALAGPNASPEVVSKAKEFVNDKRNEFWATEAKMYKALDANLSKDPTGQALAQFLQAKGMTRREYEKQRDDAIQRGESLAIDSEARRERIAENARGGTFKPGKNTDNQQTLSVAPKVSGAGDIALPPTLGEQASNVAGFVASGLGGVRLGGHQQNLNSIMSRVAKTRELSQNDADTIVTIAERYPQLQKGIPPMIKEAVSARTRFKFSD